MYSVRDCSEPGPYIIFNGISSMAFVQCDMARKSDWKMDNYNASQKDQYRST